jgi:hypothetical protein
MDETPKPLISVPDVMDESGEVRLIARMLSDLASLNQDARERVLQTVSTYFGFSSRPTSAFAVRSTGNVSNPQPGPSSVPSFSEDRSMSPKQFLMEKQPRTDVERVACLAYYLTHYLNTPYFKTLEISRLNTEAAQVKFSNATVAVDNATKQNYLVQATKGNKQLSAFGEQFVQALPDRERAKMVMAGARRPRRKNRREVEIEQTQEE